VYTNSDHPKVQRENLRTYDASRKRLNKLQKIFSCIYEKFKHACLKVCADRNMKILPAKGPHVGFPLLLKFMYHNFEKYGLYMACLQNGTVAILLCLIYEMMMLII